MTDGPDNTRAEPATRDEAVARILELAHRFELDAADLGLVLSGQQPASGSVAARVFGTIGGLFMVAGIAAFVAMQWEQFGSAARVLVTLGAGMALFVSAIIMLRQRNALAVAQPFLALAQVLQPTGMMVAFAEYGGDGDADVAYAITAALMTIQALSALRLVSHEILMLSAIFFAGTGLAAVASIADIESDLAGLAIGTGATLLAAGLMSGRYWLSAWAAAGIGSIILYLSIWSLVSDTVIEPVFLLITCAGLYVSVLTLLRPLLFTSGIALLAYLSYIVAEHFADSLGAPLALMLVGLLFVGVGYLLLRLNRRHFAKG